MPKRTNRFGETESSINLYLSDDDHFKKLKEICKKLKKSQSEVIRMGIDLIHEKEHK